MQSRVKTEESSPLPSPLKGEGVVLSEIIYLVAN